MPNWAECLKFERCLDAGRYDQAALMLRLGDGGDWPDLVSDEVVPLNQALYRYGLQVTGPVDDWRVTAVVDVPAKGLCHDDATTE